MKSTKSHSCSEDEVRHEFIEPLFERLGWDVHNANGYADSSKDVVFEDFLKTMDCEFHALPFNLPSFEESPSEPTLSETR